MKGTRLPPATLAWLTLGLLASRTSSASPSRARSTIPAHPVPWAGVVNMSVLGFAALQQSGMGWILDRNWKGAMLEGARIYDAAAYHAAFLWLAVSALVGVVSLALTREAYCRLRVETNDL